MYKRQSFLLPVPSLDRSDDGTGSRKEERRGATEADPTEGQLGGRVRDWGVGPSGERSITLEGLRSRLFLGQPETVIHVLKGRGGNDNFPNESLRESPWIRDSLR